MGGMMNANTANAQSVQQPELGRLILQRLIQVLVVAAIQAAILFLAAGDLRWGWGWANVGVYVGVLAFNLLVFTRVPHGRELIAERGQVKEGAKSWDRTLAMLASLV